MEKRIKIEVVDGEFHLPEHIIQHIQSFLTIKEANETITFSKSWYMSWLTRPNIELNQRDYGISGYTDLNRFRLFAKKTVERYEELNLRIESFKLFVKDIFLTKELIIKAIRMGVVDLQFETGMSTLVIPHEVLESVYLLRLSATNCTINSKFSNRSSLESLSLFRVCIYGDIIWEIISSCHSSLEKLVLSKCKCLRKNESHRCSATMCTRMLDLNHGMKNHSEFHKLKCLFIERVKISSLFFIEFSSRFPSVKDLSVHHCSGYEDIHICSPSLECISFADNCKTLRVKLDVPGVRKLSLSGLRVPSLSFVNDSGWEYKLEISLTWNTYTYAWFIKLNTFLGNLNQPLSSLTLTLGSNFLENYRGVTYNFPKDDGSPKPIVENLMLTTSLSYNSPLLDPVFWCFHPKFIYQNWMPKSCPNKNNELLKRLCKKLFMQEETVNCNRNYLRDLGRVSVDVFEDSVGKFQPLPWKMLLDASAAPEKEIRRIRFNLHW